MRFLINILCGFILACLGVFAWSFCAWWIVIPINIVLLVIAICCDYYMPTERELSDERQDRL